MPDSPHRRTVFIVDDDASVRDALALLLSLRGYATAMFASAEHFLAALDPAWRGCVLADIRMPGMSGLDLQLALARMPVCLPIIVITGHGDIAAARQAFKASAVDFLEKPLAEAQLVRAIDAALDGLDSSLDSAAAAPAARVEALSARERQVMLLVVDGMDNRGIARQLGISPRTVEVHKARVMSKLGAHHLADLIRITQRLPREA